MMRLVTLLVTMMHAAAAPPPATTLDVDVDFGEFLPTVDHLWDWRWQRRYILALSDLSGDLQHCGAGGAAGPCCIAALPPVGSPRHCPTLARRDTMDLLTRTTARSPAGGCACRWRPH